MVTQEVQWSPPPAHEQTGWTRIVVIIGGTEEAYWKNEGMQMQLQSTVANQVKADQSTRDGLNKMVGDLQGMLNAITQRLDKLDEAASTMRVDNGVANEKVRQDLLGLIKNVDTRLKMVEKLLLYCMR